MATGDKGKSRKPLTDFRSLSDGLESAAKAFGEKLKKHAKSFGDALDKRLEKAAKKFKKINDKNTKKSEDTMFSRLKKGWNKFWDGGLGKALKTIALIGAFFIGILVQAFRTFDGFLITTGKQFGLMSRDKNGLVGTIMDASTELKYLGQNFGDIVGSVTTLTNKMGLADGAAIKMATSLAESALNVGVSNDEAAELATTFTRIMGVNKENAGAMMEGFAMLADAQGVSPSAVMKDIAKNAEFSAKFSKGMGTNILNTAISAKKLGVELSTIEKVMNGLLDFETSITKEMEASVILGKALNYNRARQLALEGDMSGAMAEILNQVGGQAEFDRMNAIERQVLADSIGVSVNELAAFAKGSRSASEEQRILEEEAAAAMKAQQEETRKSLSAITDLMAVIHELWMFLLKTFKPVFDEITKSVKSLATAIKNSFKGMTDEAIIAETPISKLQEAMKNFQDDVEQGGLSTAISNLFKVIGKEIASFVSDVIWWFLGEFWTAILFMVAGIALFNKALGTAGPGAMKGAAAFGIIAISSIALAEGLKQLAEVNFLKLAGAALVLVGTLGGFVLLLNALTNPKMAAAAGVLLLVAGAAYVVGMAIEFITPLIQIIGDVLIALFQGIVDIIDIVIDGIVRLAEVIGNTLIGVMEQVVGMIDAFFGGIVDVIEAVQGFANLDAENLLAVADAYFYLAGALTALAAAQASQGLGSLVGSVGNFLGSGIDAVTNFVFGEDSKAVDTTTPIVKIDSSTPLTISSTSISAIGTAVAKAVVTEMVNVQLKTEITGEQISVVLTEYENTK